MNNDDAEQERAERTFEEMRRNLSDLFGSEFAEEAFKNLDKEQVLKKLKEGSEGQWSFGRFLETTKDIASRGGQVIASLYDGAKKTVTQEEAWEQMERSIEELTSVVRVQHAMILDLLTRVTHLEGGTSGGSGPRS